MVGAGWLAGVLVRDDVPGQGKWAGVWGTVPGGRGAGVSPTTIRRPAGACPGPGRFSVNTGPGVAAGVAVRRRLISGGRWRGCPPPGFFPPPPRPPPPPPPRGGGRTDRGGGRYTAG